MGHLVPFSFYHQLCWGGWCLKRWPVVPSSLGKQLKDSGTEAARKGAQKFSIWQVWKGVAVGYLWGPKMRLITAFIMNRTFFKGTENIYFKLPLVWGRHTFSDEHRNSRAPSNKNFRKDHLIFHALRNNISPLCHAREHGTKCNTVGGRKKLS